MEIGRKKRGVLIIILIFTVYSIIFVYSSSFPTAIRNYSGHPYHFIMNQAIWYAMAYIAFFVVASIDYTKWIHHRWKIYGVGMVLLCAVMVIGKRINGAKRWIGLGPITFSPAELAKLCLLIFIAIFLAQAIQEGRKNLSLLLPVGAYSAIYIILIFLEKDLGTIIVLASTLFVLLYLSPIQKRWLLLVAGSMIGLAGVAMLTSAHRISRLKAFFSGISQGGVAGGYQVQQSIVGIGHGGFFGLGIGNGIQKFYYLPELYTDFIFSNIGEEGGFIMAFFLILTFIAFLYFGVTIALECRTWFAKYYIIGYFFMIVIQAVMNMFVATGMMPATGRPLPFISYGGTSIVILFIGMGIVFNILKQEEQREVKQS